MAQWVGILLRDVGLAQWVGILLMLCRVSRAGYILVKHVMGPQGIRLGDVVMEGCIGGSRGGLCGNGGEGTVGRAPIGETSWRLRVGSGIGIGTVCGGGISISHNRSCSIGFGVSNKKWNHLYAENNGINKVMEVRAVHSVD